jgi:uncharacterized protein YkwD
MKIIFLALFSIAAFAQQPSGSEFEMRVFELTNIERVNNGLPPLAWHNGLADIARTHSEDLMRNGIGWHIGSDGSNPIERLNRADIPNMSFRAENVAYGQPTPERVVETWMNSEGHRANILIDKATHLGVGFVGPYWTQVFGRLR